MTEAAPLRNVLRQRLAPSRTRHGYSAIPLALVTSISKKSCDSTSHSARNGGRATSFETALHGVRPSGATAPNLTQSRAVGSTRLEN